MNVNKTAELIMFLQSIEGLGNVKINKIIKIFKNLYDFKSCGADTLTKLFPFLTKNILDKIYDNNYTKYIAEKNNICVYNSIKMGIKIIDIFCDEYPLRLRGIADAPPLLYLKGTLQNNLIPVACVGTRKPDLFGKFIARDIVTSFRDNNIITVAGLADGIDTIVHSSSISNNIKTCAVVATGLDMIYPSQNAQLLFRIIENGGAVISEHPIGTKIQKPNFIMRDRIQSGISISTVIIQTEIDGGTMHTAKFAFSQNKNLFVIDKEALLKNEKSEGFLNSDYINNKSNLRNYSGCSYLIDNNMGKAVKKRSDYKLFYEEHYKAIGQQSFI